MRTVLVSYHWPERPPGSCQLVVRCQGVEDLAAMFARTRPGILIDSIEPYVGRDHETISTTAECR